MLAWVLLVTAALSGINAKRIVGGEVTCIEEYPSIAQLERYVPETDVWFQICAANVLNRKYAVTAAHCFMELPEDSLSLSRIRAGTSYRSCGGEIHALSRVDIHPTFVPDIPEGDIALLQLADVLTYSDVIQPVAIPPQDFELPDNLPVTYAGWGATIQDGTSSPVLLDVTVYTVNRDVCRERYLNLEPNPSNVTENMICTGILDVGGKDACQGDSGGPLYFDNILVGIVSWGEGCANDTYPGVSTKVSSYTDWILKLAV